jgi:hypothetical protein
MALKRALRVPCGLSERWSSPLPLNNQRDGLSVQVNSYSGANMAMPIRAFPNIGTLNVSRRANYFPKIFSVLEQVARRF